MIVAHLSGDCKLLARLQSYKLGRDVFEVIQVVAVVPKVSTGNRLEISVPCFMGFSLGELTT